MARSALSKTAPQSISTRPAIKSPPHFAKALFAQALPEDLRLLGDKEREFLAASLWTLAQKRTPRTPLIRIYNPAATTQGSNLDHTVLEIVNDDMPFIVASVTGALQKRGHGIHFIVHPVITIERDAKGHLIASSDKSTNGKPESFLHIQCDYIADPKALEELRLHIESVLRDVRAAVEDWDSMRQRLIESKPTASSATGIAPTDTQEANDFLEWITANNFTFLGYRDIDLQQKNGQLVSVKVQDKGGLGVLRDPSTKVFGGMRALEAQHVQHLKRYVREHDLLVVTKTNLLSQVHRMVPMDAIFIRRFDKNGHVIGERLFVGLFTSQSYSQKPTEIPFLRGKAQYVLTQANTSPDSHNGKALIHTLNNYPHDELFQITKEELLANCLGILQLQERARVALYVRQDPFQRFVTCLIYVPRDRYDSALRAKIKHHLETAFSGQAHDWNIRIDDSLLARLFVTIHTPHAFDYPDAAQLETDLRNLCRSWHDQLRDHLTRTHGEAQAMRWLSLYGDAFPISYQDNVAPDMAIHDIRSLDRCATLPNGGLVTDMHQDKNGLLHLKLFHKGKPIVLSDVMPKIEDMGLNVDYMGGPYDITAQGSDSAIYIHEFVGSSVHPVMAKFAQSKLAFEGTLQQVWTGHSESDSFNQLALIAGLTARQIVVLRLLARYLRQLRLPYSYDMVATTFVAHPQIAEKLVQLFLIRHDPAFKGNRANTQKALLAEITDALADIKAIEEDRIIRRYMNLIESSLRTNYFQTGADGQPKSYISVKFDSRAIDFMPLPKPLYEIFIYSPRMEAIHLRGGKVARGGIRWSDRREDFRSEILGLIKAQMVKNTVIVPVGSKGGFILKNPPVEADKFHAEGVECYRIMMRGLLDITDNRKGTKIAPPVSVVRHDGDDPYLVVAADKGTAKFSDIANAMSQEYGFWLDDAFASGGSAGYDHKGMGITARGAWEAVKRHFRELGKDIQTTDFTCIGVGDMSGDVFGNGMLLSPHTRLIAAFDHRHIFCDPQADATTGFAERQRMFNLPRSSWDDYDRKKISKGGGVFPRNVKSIAISPEMKKAYGLTADTLSPTDLIQALLKAQVELLYFGGIGTYVKAESETHDAVSDRANDALRVNGADINAQVIGEGANLGMTQCGRIEYAQKGGRLNTDAIDNSAGVDTSDHEVNIKILCKQLMDDKAFDLNGRNKFLRSMTDNVGKLVLKDNYDQPLALSIAEAASANNLAADARAIAALEKTGLLNRAVEYLPDADTLADRGNRGTGLTRPESAVVMAYTKLWLYDEILASNLPDLPALSTALHEYFPDAVQKKYAHAITQHQLRREIVATQVTNDIVNRAGHHILFDLMEQCGRNAADITRAYLLVRQSLMIDALWKDIEKLDNTLPTAVQISLFASVRRVVGKAMAALLEAGSLPKDLSAAIEHYIAALAQLSPQNTPSDSLMTTQSKAMLTTLLEQKVPSSLAQRLAVLPQLAATLGFIDLAKTSKQPLSRLAAIHFAIGETLGFDWLQEGGRMLPASTSWRREALASTLAEINATQRRLTAMISAQSAKSADHASMVTTWLAAQVHADSYRRALQEWQTHGRIDQAMLDIANRKLKALAA